MGGTNEEKVEGLRFHQSGGEVHVHDDDKGVKFTANPKKFRVQVEEAFTLLKEDDGLVKIEGTSKEKFCIIKEDGTFSAVILEKRGIKQKLQKFIRSC